MKLSKSSQSGFTLVEIAIVLVIIGILLAGVLKGQSLINNGRIKGLVNNLNAVSSAYNGYIDRYQAVPGTEPVAATTARGWVLSQPGIGVPLSVLNLPYATTYLTATTQTSFWDVLGAAGFFTTTALTTTNPVSASGGFIGVTYSPFGLVGVSACISSLTPVLAEGVEVVIDGPLPTAGAGIGIGNNSGSLRGISSAVGTIPTGPAAPAAAAFNETAAVTWNECKTL